MDDLAQRLLNELLIAIEQQPDRGTSGCLLTDIGRLLVQLAELVAGVSDRLVENKYVREDNRDMVIAQAHAQSDGNDVHVAAEYLEDKLQLLRHLCDQLESASNLVSEAWNAAASVPPYLNSPSPTLAQLLDIERRTRGSSMLATPGPSFASTSTAMDSPPASGVGALDFGAGPTLVDSELASAVEATRFRGTGRYTCPSGPECNRGGFKEGQLVVFTRNSEFRAHMAKHQRNFVCELPGCPNKPDKRRFAREDQLKRHQQNVHRRSG